jgi:hypothetical protein
MTNFIDTAASRETDQSVMEAILYVADGDEAEAARIWQDPTEAEWLAIWERATKNGLIDGDSLQWGEAALGNKYSA